MPFFYLAAVLLALLQTEAGTPYMLYKDACNSKSNQKNLGTIKRSNLSSEIIEYTDPDEVQHRVWVCQLVFMHSWRR